jgi:hypothetical protein
MLPQESVGLSTTTTMVLVCVCVYVICRYHHFLNRVCYFAQSSIAGVDPPGKLFQNYLRAHVMIKAFANPQEMLLRI